MIRKSVKLTFKAPFSNKLLKNWPAGNTSDKILNHVVNKMVLSWKRSKIGSNKQFETRMIRPNYCGPGIFFKSSICYIRGTFLLNNQVIDSQLAKQANNDLDIVPKILRFSLFLWTETLSRYVFSNYGQLVQPRQQGCSPSLSSPV